MSIIEQALPRWEKMEPENFRKLPGSRSSARSPGRLQPAREIHLDLERLSARGLLTAISRDIHMLEQYRLIKQPLLRKITGNEQHAFGHGEVAENDTKLILVTSALPDEGKTFTAINLAMSMAMERDHPIVLLDADLEKRDVSTMFGVASEVGLTEFLVDSSMPLAQVLFRTNVENLSFLPAGTVQGQHAELISSKRMRQLLSDLCREYGAVVVDSPPLLFSSSATVMANLAGQVVIVVEVEKTPQRVVQEAVQLIGGPSRDIGFVLNKDGPSARARHRYSRYQR